jgi:pimeloyl-[acyl-carrier protein] synthase
MPVAAEAGGVLSVASFLENPDGFFNSLLSGPPQQLALSLPAIAVARYCDVTSVLADPVRFSSRIPPTAQAFVSIFDPFGGAAVMLFSDPPAHTRLRRLASHCFRSLRATKLAAAARRFMDEALNEVGRNGEFDAVTELAEPLALRATSDILGIPQDKLSELKTRTDQIFGAAGAFILSKLARALGDDTAASNYPDFSTRFSHASTAEAIAALRTNLGDEVQHHLFQQHDGLISALLSFENNPEIAPDETFAMIVLLLLASSTTTALISNSLLLLATHQDQLALLGSERRLLPNAIDEILRYRSPVQIIVRVSMIATEVGGIRVPANAALLLLLGAANRDPAHFADPDRFDITRNPNLHLAFGEGIHSCIGAHLARNYAAVAIGAMVDRFPQFHLAHGDGAVQYRTTFLSRELSHLRLAIG